MAEEAVTLESPDAVDGTTDATPEMGQVAEAPEGASGQAAEGEGASLEAPEQGQAEDSFFDPSTLDETLLPAYKQMQAAYTSKTQSLAEQRKQIEALQQFAPIIEAYQRDPKGTLQYLAQQQGINMGQPEQSQQDQFDPSSWEPQSWGEVIERASEQIMQRVQQQFQPVVQRVQQQTAKQVESQLTDIDPEWKRYESQMAANLQKHPSLKDDPEALYRMTVPMSEIEGRVQRRLLEKNKEKAKAARVAGRSSATKTEPQRKQARTIAEAWEFAKSQS